MSNARKPPTNHGAPSPPSLSSALRSLHIWQFALIPALSAAVDEMIRSGDLSIATANSLDDVGQFLQRLGSDIIDERNRRGMPMPDGPDD